MKKIIIAITFFLSACSLNKPAVKTVSSIIDNGMSAITEETDLDYAKEALPANLKLMEIMLSDTQDKKLLLNSAMGFCGYAWAFLDEENPSQAQTFYRKGINYSDKLIKKGGKLEPISKKNSEAAFWNLFCKSAMVNSDLTNMENLTMLEEIEAMGQKLAEVNPRYMNNAVYSLLGSYYASKPKMMGGDIQKAKNFFDKAIENNGESFLINLFMYAKTYAVAAQDERLFDRLMEKIENHDAKGENAFFNAIAQKKAKKLKEAKSEYF